MAKTSRRNLLKGAAAGSVAAGLGMVNPEKAIAEKRTGRQHHSHSPIIGILANATVSFGQWQTDPPLDRFPDLNPIPRNQHQLVPNEAIIKAGGSVNFIIGGFHHVLVYGDGTKPGDINANLTIAPTAGGPPLINDPNNRVYRGLDPSLLPQDRVEVLHFPKPGRYLVICGVQPHFVNDNMFGFVRVLP
jgi:hypothetical protein